MKILNNLDNLDRISDGETYKKVSSSEKAFWNNKQDTLTSENAGNNVIITTVDGVVKINSTGSGGSVNIDNDTITTNSDDEIQTVGVKDVKTTYTDKFWTGTLAEYNAISSKDPNTFYCITDDGGIEAITTDDIDNIFEL